MTPLVTIGIPTYKRPELLRETLRSALGQSYGNLEIIVSDNAADPETAALVSSFADPRVRYLAQPTNLGMVGNWNALLKAARGDYFLLLSDDDLLNEWGIERLLDRYLAEESSHDPPAFVYGAVELFYDGEPCESQHYLPVPPRETAREIIKNFLLFGRPTFACCILFRLSEAMRSDGYDTRLKLLFDADFWMRAVQQGGNACYVHEQVARYRIHMQSESSRSGRLAWAEEMDRLIAARQRDKIIDRRTAGLARFMNHIRERVPQETSYFSKVRNVIRKGYQEKVSLFVTLYYALRILAKIPRTSRIQHFARWLRSLQSVK